jgi:hypothetical protein
VTRIESDDPYYGNDCIHGGWYLESFNGTTNPAATAAAVPVTPVPITLGSNPLDPTSTFAVHVSGSGQANTESQYSYAQLTAWLNTASGTQIGTVDVSQYTGVQFYAIIKSGAPGVSLMVGNLYTDPSGGMCTTTGGSKSCYDHPATLLESAATWTKYQIPFADLEQIGYGNQSPLGYQFPKSAIVQVKWNINIPGNGPVPPWELWIDDLTFY